MSRYLGVLANQSQELLPGDNTCPNGTFRDSNNNASEANRRNPCQSCPLGFFCVHGNRIKCPVGHYCPPGSSQALACPPGNYCPRGQFYPVQCSAGSYNPSNTSTNNSACLSCPPGLYCFMPGLNKPTGPCLPGFYCTGQGSNTPTPVDGVMGNMCPPGKYCPRGAAEPLPCPEGYYNPYTAREACDACPQNLTCPVGSVFPFECDPENESVNVQCTLQTGVYMKDNVFKEIASIFTIRVTPFLCCIDIMLSDCRGTHHSQSMYQSRWIAKVRKL